LVEKLALFCEEEKVIDFISLPDHTVYLPPDIDALEVWTTLAALASKTRRIRLASIVSDLFRHHPVALAQMVATVDIISGGRTIFGVGAGEAMNLDPFGIAWDRPISKMYEAIKVVKKLWIESPNRVDYDGKFYKLRKACLIKPLQSPHPPIWIAANSERTLKIAAELCDGWIPICLPPEIYEERYKMLKELALHYKREPGAIEPGLFLYFAVAESDDVAMSIIRDPARRIALMLPDLLERLGYHAPRDFSLTKALFSDPHVVKRLEEASREVPFEGVVDKMFLWGSPTRCIERINTYIKSGVRTFVLRPLAPKKDILQMTQYFARKVLSYFKELKSG